MLVLFSMPLLSHAFSAIAFVPGHAPKTVYAGWNWPTQGEADKVALDGCRATAKESGISKLADKCRVGHRQKVVGAGAIVCGKDECSFVGGYETNQAAINAAYKSCTDKFKDCQKTGITSWWDEAGYPRKQAKDVGQGEKVACSPPAGQVVRSKTQCSNGDCIRTFENGCQVRFQAPYCHEPVSGKWEWKPDGC